MSFVAFIDASSMYGWLPRHLLFSLCTDVYLVRWSPHVLDELYRNLHENRPDVDLSWLFAEMQRAFPDASVRGYESLIGTMPEGIDPKDRHVVAAAITARADVIVTDDINHIPSDLCEAEFDIEVQTTDRFLANQFMIRPHLQLDRLVHVCQTNKRPPQTIPELCHSLMRRAPPLTAFALEIRRYAGSHQPHLLEQWTFYDNQEP